MGHGMSWFIYNLLWRVHLDYIDPMLNDRGTEIQDSLPPGSIRVPASPCPRGVALTILRAAYNMLTENASFAGGCGWVTLHVQQSGE